MAGLMLAPLRAPLTTLEAMLRGYVPMTMSISKLSTMPVDVLIDEDGKVVEAHYCRDTVDHLPIDRLISFAKGTSISNGTIVDEYVNMCVCFSSRRHFLFS